MRQDEIIHVDPEIQAGTPCFTGTRVPVRSLFDYLARGRSMDYFLAQFPSVSREQAVGLLRLAADEPPAPPSGANRRIA